MMDRRANKLYFADSLNIQPRYPRLQILTIKKPLGGKKLEYPQLGKATFKKAQVQGKKELKGQTTFGW